MKSSSRRSAKTSNPEGSSLDDLWALYPWVLEQARRLSDEPEDLAHDVILKVAPKVGGVENLKAYVFIALKHQSWQADRRLEYGPLPLLVDDAVILREELDRHVRHLPRIERLIFSAVFEHGMTAKQLSGCMGVSLRRTHEYIKAIKDTIIDGITQDADAGNG